MAPAPRVPLIFGTMTIGYPEQNGVRIDTKEGAQEIIDVFLSHGHKEIDTARMYANETTEKRLSEINLKDASIDTKPYLPPMVSGPTVVPSPRVYPSDPGDHLPAKLRETFLTSLKTLKRDKVRVLYLHAPDRSVPFEDTVEEVNKLYNEGLFEIFGLSNYAAWEVAEIVGICKAKGWVQPKIYQAMYHAITRAIEPELVPCLRKYGLRLVTYNPLAGGFFAGKLASMEDSGEKGGRFDNSGHSTKMGQMYRDRYVKQGFFEALDYLKKVAAEHNLRLTEIALRWVQHHSVLTPSDGVILGASSTQQLKENLEDSAKGPLPDAVVEALDEANRIVQRHDSAPLYWR